MEARDGNSILDFETLFSDFQETLNGSGFTTGTPKYYNVKVGMGISRTNADS